MKVFLRYAGSTGEGNQFIVNFDKRKEISKTHEDRAIKKIRALFEWAREERQIEKEIKKTTGKSIEEMLWGAIMTKEQEAQQAQTVAIIKLWFSLGRSTMKSNAEVEARKRVSDLLEIVDSQAQKIAEQAEKITEIEADCVRYDEAIMIQGKNAGELRRKIAEQAKEIELFREYKEAVETEILIDTKYDAPDESWVDAVGLKINALEQTTDSKEVAK